MLAKIKGLMSVVGGVVFGGMVGVVASGGVQAWLGWRGQERAREAAALAVLGDLYAWGSTLELILGRDQWPDRLELDASLSTWREFRASFADASTAWEWALVDSFYATLERAGLTVEPGAPLGDQARSRVEELRALLLRVQRIAAERAVSSEGERRRAIAALSGAD